MASHVGGHDHNGIAEADPAAGGIRQHSLFHDLQQNPQHLRVCLFQFIEQHQAVGTAADGLGQLAALLIAHITGRGTDEPGHGLLFHIFRHIQPEHGLPGTENLLGQHPTQLGFSYAGGAGEEQTGNGPPRIPDAGITPPDCLSHSGNRLALADDFCRQQTLQLQQPLPLSGGETPYGDSRALGYHPGNVRSVYVPAAHAGLCQMLHFVPKLCRPLELPLPDGSLQSFFQFLPGGAAPAAVQLLQPSPGGSLVQQINGLVRQIQVGQVSGGQPHRLPDGIVGDAQMVMPLQPRPQSLENGQGGLLAGLLHRNRPEPAFQRRVLFDILPVFLPGGGSQHLQLSPTQGGLENVRRVNGALGGSRSHNGVHFIHKENHVSAAADFRQHIPKPFLEFAPVFRPRHQGGHIQAHQPLFFQLRRHAAGGHPLSQPLGNGGFAHPRLPHQSRVILAFPAQDADDRVNFPFPADHRIHRCGFRHQILTELLQQSQTRFLLLRSRQHTLLPAQILHRLVKQFLRGKAGKPQQLPGGSPLLPSHGQKQMLGLNLPNTLASGLSGGSPQKVLGLRGQPLGQGQLRGSQAVEQLDQRLRQLRVNPQLPEH